MNEVQTPAAEAAGLSQLERLGDTFTAPSRTFADIKRGNRSWWMPFLLVALFSYLFFAVVSQRVGVQQAIENQLSMNTKAQERLAQATPEQRERGMRVWAGFTEGMFIAAPAISLLTIVVLAAIFMGTINFGFGGKATFGETFAVCYYAWLPNVVKLALGIAVTWFQPPEQFNIANFAPTNAAALFMDPTTTHKALYTLASLLDITTIWSLVLIGMGLAIVAGLKRSSGYTAVFGWFVIYLLFKVGSAAAFS